MRKLDDGTYMYDQEQPYERVVAGIIITLIMLAVTLTFGFFTIRAWMNFGADGFLPPTGTGFMNLLAFVFFLYLTVKIARGTLKRRAAVKPGGSDER